MENDSKAPNFSKERDFGPPPQHGSIWPRLWRGMKLRCPRCGDGKLFRAFLKPVEHCSNCGQRWDTHHQDRLRDRPFDVGATSSFSNRIAGTVPNPAACVQAAKMRIRAGSPFPPLHLLHRLDWAYNGIRS